MIVPLVNAVVFVTWKMSVLLTFKLMSLPTWLISTSTHVLFTELEALAGEPAKGEYGGLVKMFASVEAARLVNSVGRLVGLVTV